MDECTPYPNDKKYIRGSGTLKFLIFFGPVETLGGFLILNLGAFQAPHRATDLALICIQISISDVCLFTSNSVKVGGQLAKSRPQSRPKVGPTSAKSRPKVSQKSAQSRPKVAPQLVKRRPKVGQKFVQSRPKFGPKLANMRSKVGPKSVQSWTKVGSMSAKSRPNVG